MTTNVNLIELLDNCLLPKLAKSTDESENHPEYEIRHQQLQTNLNTVLLMLGNLDLKINPLDNQVFSHLFILYEELKTDGPWNTQSIRKLATKVDKVFHSLYNTPLHQVLCDKSFNNQEIFDTCVRILHETVKMNNFKHYPSLIEVYCALIGRVKEYNVTVNPPLVMPLSLIMVDDFVKDNKIKGLYCLAFVLQSTTHETFSEGNYYEVIYDSLKKVVVEKDIEITKLVLPCLVYLLRVLPCDVQEHKLDDIYLAILEEIYMTENINRKTECLKFIKSIIQMHGVNCVKFKLFKDVIIECLNDCCNDAVAPILLNDALECLRVWIQHCWCIWRLSSDHKMLSMLFKSLYTCKQKELVQKIQGLILTLITLCSEEEQKKIYNSLVLNPEILSQQYIQLVQAIKNNMNIKI